eukprot:SAG11_NODE_2253_length_3630_cov_9.405551_3_plen_99_part_00
MQAELERGVELAAFEASRAALHERLRELRAETAARKGVEAEAEAARLQQELDAQHRAEECALVQPPLPPLTPLTPLTPHGVDAMHAMGVAWLTSWQSD